MAFVLSFSAIAGGVILIVKGFDIQGFATIITALAALAGVFIFGRHKAAQDLLRSITAQSGVPPR